MAISFNPLNVLSGFNLASINTNFNNIKTALTDGLSRSGSGSNQMEADIDLNSNDLLNVNQTKTNELFINGELVTPDALQTIPSSVMRKSDYDPSDQVGDLLVSYFRGREEIWVTDPEFGGLLLGSGDDWAPVFRAAITKAVSTDNRIVYIPPRTYTFKTSLVLTGSDGFVMLKGAGRDERGSRIVVDFDGVGIAFGGTLPYITGLAFIGDKTTYTSSRAIKTAKGANTDDMDVFLEFNAFHSFPLAIEHVGRGFICRNNDFALNDKDIDISWPTSGVEGTGLHILPNGFRKWIITSNHSHSSGGFITTSGADKDDFRGAVIANNLQDIGRQFFSGGIRDSSITGNVAENCNSAPVFIDAGGNNMTITGNKFGGMENNDDATIHRPGNAIWFNTGSTIIGLVCVGNVFTYTDASALQFSNGITESTITGNTFQDYNKLMNANDAAIEIITGNLVRSTISSNSFDENPTGNPPIRIGGSVQSSYIIGNSWNNTALLYTVTGSVDSQSMTERSIGEFEGRFAFVASKAAHLRSKSLFNGTWTAGESVGGVVVETADTNGGGPGIAGAMRAVVNSTSGAGVDLRFSVSTSSTRDVPVLDINSVGMFPVNTNTSDLGSTSLRYRVVYTQSLNLNGVTVQTNAGTPEGVVTAPVGSLCTDTTGGKLYVKATGTGNTGWVVAGTQT